MRIKCKECQTTLDVPEQAVGKLIRCPKCAGEQRVPNVVQAVVVRPSELTQPPPSPSPSKKPPKKPEPEPEIEFAADVADFADEPVFDPLSAPIGRPDIGVSPVLYNRPAVSERASRGPKKSGSSTPWFLIGGCVAGGLLLIVLMSIGITIAIKAGRNKANLAGSPTTNSDLNALSQGLVFPSRGRSQLLTYEGATAQVYEIDFRTTNRSAQPASSTQLRVYLPSNDLPPNSTPCVLVAPAGTNLLSGTDIGLGETDYHDETMPYVNAGMIVIQYSIDGWMPDMDAMDERAALSAFSKSYKEFSQARWGTLNAKVALDYCLEKFPEIDEREIYSAGHSSAATLSLLVAAAEPRLKKCIAYAPVCNLSVRFGNMLQEPTLQRVLPGIDEYTDMISPNRNVAKLNCPIFLFHARDDSNEPFQYTSSYARQLERAGKAVEFHPAMRGDHYQSMIDEGIPLGIQWLQSK